MSLSVDDLVNSLSASHIGQEAMDVAALQSQLAQLFRQSPSHHHQANTPTRTTPSSSFSLTDAHRQAFLSGLTKHHPDWDEIEEDERMVEDLLIPSSPITPNPLHYHYHPSQHYYSNTTAYFTQPTHLHHHHHPQQQPPFRPFSASSPITTATTPPPLPFPTSNSFTLPDASPQSLFTTTDPFYAQAIQQQQQQQSNWGTSAPSTSAFSQAGQISPSSPFHAPPHHHQPLFYTTATTAR